MSPKTIKTILVVSILIGLAVLVTKLLPYLIVGAIGYGVYRYLKRPS